MITGLNADFKINAVMELVTTALCGLHRVDDQFVFVSATLGDDGYIHLSATRVSFTGDNSTVRVLLYPTQAMSASV